MSYLYRLKTLIGPLGAILLLLFFDLYPEHPEVTRTAAVALWMAIWWITEAVPLAITALLPIILYPVLGIMNGKTVAPIYFNHIIFLFIGGFMVALAMQKWNLHKRIALKVLLLVGVKPKNILLGFMGATAFLSMWISNTATTMMMLPIALAIILRLERLFEPAIVKKFSVGLFLGIAYSASIGGIATLVGTPPNLSFSRIFSISFPNAPEISFASWFIFASPLSLICLVIVWFLISKIFFRHTADLVLDRNIVAEQYRDLGPMMFEEKVILADFLALVLLWLFRADIKLGSFTLPGWSGLFEHPSYLNDGTVAITMAVLLFILPSKNKSGRIMNWEAAKGLPWNIVLLFGGGFALASGFKESGLSLWMGGQMSWVQNMHPVVLVAVICFTITFLTELTSNTATAEMILPILAGLAAVIQINPLMLMIPATLSCSYAFMLPVATPPNAIVFGSNRIKISEMARFGVWINLLGVILITAAVFLLGRIVFNIDLSAVPAWVN